MKNAEDIVNELINPDSEIIRKYRWDIPYQQEILSMLLMDKVFLIQSMQLINPVYFTDVAHQLICSILFEFFDKYKEIPTKIVIDNEIRIRKKEDPKLFYYLGELKALTSDWVPKNREVFLDKITEFAKERALEMAFRRSFGILGDEKVVEKWDRIRDLMRKALIVDRKFDGGLDYFTTPEERYERMKQEQINKEVFKTGFPGIDDGIAGGGLCRGEIGAYVALPGVGKSVALVKTSIVNLIQGKRVLYISLEMDQDKIARRFDAQLAAVGINKLIENKDIVIQNIKDHVAADQDKRRLIIKQFPAGTANVETVRAYMAQMNLYGFKPDLLMVDYVGEMKDFEGIKTYESRQRLVRDLRGFGVEEKHATITAMQPNRRGREQQEEGFIDDDTLGDSFGQARPLDAMWSMNQTSAEKSAGIGRIFVVKHRDGKSRYAIYFKQNKETLDIQEISSESHHAILSNLKEHKSDEQLKNEKPFIPNKGKKTDGMWR